LPNGYFGLSLLTGFAPLWASCLSPRKICCFAGVLPNLPVARFSRFSRLSVASLFGRRPPSHRDRGWERFPPQEDILSGPFETGSRLCRANPPPALKTYAKLLPGEVPEALEGEIGCPPKPNNPTTGREEEKPRRLLGRGGNAGWLSLNAFMERLNPALSAEFSQLLGFNGFRESER